MNEDTRKILGTAAGGIAGARIGAATSKSHPIAGGVTGGAVGGIFGMMFAELVNAVTQPKDSQPRQYQIDPSDAELAGFVKGSTMTMSIILGALAAYGEEVITWLREDKVPTKADLLRLLWTNKGKLEDGIMENAHQMYAAVRAAFIQAARAAGDDRTELPFEIDFDEEARKYRRSVGDILARMDARISASSEFKD